MATFTNLYNTYAEHPVQYNSEQIQEMLSPYIEQFDIKIENNAITIGEEYKPLNTIKINRICAIVEEPQCIYIVLCGCIYILDKTSEKVEINIRD